MSRVEVLSGPERRRRWSTDQKRSIVAEAFAPGSSVCEVARRRDLVPGQIYRWRNELRTAAAGFTAVVVAPEPGERSPADVPVLEIELSRGIRVRIPATAPKELASAILKALVAR
jgi:transposase